MTTVWVLTRHVAQEDVAVDAAGRRLVDDLWGIVVLGVYAERAFAQMAAEEYAGVIGAPWSGPGVSDAEDWAFDTGDAGRAGFTIWRVTPYAVQPA